MFFYTFIPKLINMSLTASVAIVLILVARAILRRSPRVIAYTLWTVALLRLLCPVSIESPLSLYRIFDAPATPTSAVTSVIEYVPADIVHTAYPAVTLPVPGVSEVINEALPQGREQQVADPLEAPMAIATYVWMLGVAAMTAWAAVAYIRLRRRLSEAVPMGEGVYLADHIPSPFVLGLICPRIYLPSSLDERELPYILAHERHHIRRLDHVTRLLAFAALSIHWFNPLVWLAFILAGRDMEMSCDEAVVKQMGEGVRADYAASLLHLAAGRPVVAGFPLAFGESDPKARIKNLARWRRPAVWVSVAAVTVCAVLAVVLLTNPRDRVTELQPGSYDVGKVVYGLDFVNEAPTAAPRQYRLTPAGELYVRKDAASAWESLGVMEDYDLTRKELMSYTHDQKLIDYRLSEITDARILRVEEQNFYMLAQTAAGDTLLTYGWEDVSERGQDYSDDTSLRRIYRLIPATEEPASPPTPGSDAPITAPGDMTVWFDHYHDENWGAYEPVELVHPSFPDVIFRCDYSSITMNGEEIAGGMPVWNAFFIDLTGDGIPELCCTVSVGSGLVDDRVGVYDFATEMGYELSGRGVYDYRLMEENGRLYVTKRLSVGGELVQTGLLTLTDGALTMEPTAAAPHALEELERSITIDGTTVTFTIPDVAGEWRILIEGSAVYGEGLVKNHLRYLADAVWTPGETYTFEAARGAELTLTAVYTDLDGKAEERAVRLTIMVADSLEQAIAAALHARSEERYPGFINVESHVILDQLHLSGTPVEGSSDHLNKITVYLLVRRIRYELVDGEAVERGGSTGPTALTFDLSREGVYTLEEYWEPRDGEYYAPDIREKFPKDAAEKVLSSHSVFIGSLTEQNEEQLRLYLSGDLTTLIAKRLDEITASPAHASNPGAYIAAHEEAYAALLDYGVYTLRYCFSEFLGGGHHDLRGHIMAILCQEIAVGWGEAILMVDSDPPLTGQEWFDMFREHALILREKHTDEELRDKYPASFVLLQMLG